MRSQSVAVNFLLVSIVLLWTGVLCAEQAALQTVQDPSLNNKLAPSCSPKMSYIWLRLNDDLVSFICQFYGPVRFNASDREKICKVLTVLATLSHLVKHLEYVGEIESDEVLAYYPLLSELSFLTIRYPKEIRNMLFEWSLPKGNLGLSLFISTGPILETTPQSLASYLSHISDKSAQLVAVNYFLHSLASAPVSVNYYRFHILHNTSDLDIVSRLNLISSASSATAASILLNFASGNLDWALEDGLVEIRGDAGENSHSSSVFCFNFEMHPVILRGADSMQAIFDRNKFKFQSIQFSDEQRTRLSVFNKIKFGTRHDVMDMSEAEREQLRKTFEYRTSVPLVFHIWAREDVPANYWKWFANDLSNDCKMAKLAFDPNKFFQDHFDDKLLKDVDFAPFLSEFKNYPSSSKGKLFHELLRDKVEKHHKAVRVLFMIGSEFECLINFFIDQDDQAGLTALNNLVFKLIGRVPPEIWHELCGPCGWVRFSGMVRVCQLLGRCIDGRRTDDPLRRLVERVGAATVLSRLDFSIVRPNDVGKMLSTLGISRDQMDAAISSLGQEAAPEDDLAAVLWQFHKDAPDVHISSNWLPARHALWFYLWNEHQKAFVKHVHVNLQQYYQTEKQSL